MKPTIKTAAFVQTHFADENCLVDIEGMPAIECVLEKLAGTIAETVIVAPADENNLVFKSIAEKYNAHFFMGDKENVAKRFHDAAQKYHIDLIIRIPAVKPFFDEKLMITMLADFNKNYDSIDLLRVPYTFYQNFAVEIYKTQALGKILGQINPIDRIYWYKPHYYMDQHPDIFQVKVFDNVPEYTDEQKRKINTIFKKLQFNDNNSERPGQLDKDYYPSVYEVTQRYAYFQKYIQPEDIVLDIGCGNGYGTNTFTHAREVIGVDYDSNAVDLANKNSPANNIKYMVGDANTFMQENYFTKIISFETIEHIQCREEFIKNIHRSLKPGGTLIISTPIRKEDGLTGFAHHLYEYSINEFEELLAKNNFNIIKKLSQDYRGFIVPELNEDSRGMIFVVTK